MKKRILITGGSGFIGTNLILALQKKRFDILNVDLVPNPHLEVETLLLDLNKSDLSFIDKSFDTVIHLAALSNARLCANIVDSTETNVFLTVRMLESSRLVKIRKFIYMSSIVVYSNDNPIPLREDAKLDYFHDNYSLTKGLAEENAQYFLDRLGTPVLIFRLSNVYRPYQSWEGPANLVPQICKQALLEGKIEIWSTKPKRDWLCIDDAMEAVVRAIDSDVTGLMNIGTGVSRSVGDLVNIVSRETGVPVIALDKKVLGPSNICCDISRLKEALNYVPATSLEEGLAKTVKYYRDKIKKGPEVSSPHR